MKNVEHLHARQIILNSGWFQGSAQKLNITMYGVHICWKRVSLKINAERKIAPDLCAKIGICALGERIFSRNIYIL